MGQRKLAEQTILIVDDNEGIREILRDELLFHHARVFEASCGQEAISLFAKNPPDVIITDVVMPNGDGLSLFDQASNLAKNLERPPLILFMSGYADKHIRTAVKNRDAILLEKPFHFDLMIQMIENHGGQS